MEANDSLHDWRNEMRDKNLSKFNFIIEKSEKEITQLEAEMKILKERIKEERKKIRKAKEDIKWELM